MKKFFILSLFFLFISRVNAIEDIRINNSELVPTFNKDIYYYNYYTSSSSIIINVKYKQGEVISGSGYHEIVNGKNNIIVSSGNIKYYINVFKNYTKDDKKAILKNIIIKNYDIDFNENNTEYYINIGNEDSLDIDLDLTTYNGTIKVIGNGNFNNSDNLIKIIVNDKEYIIHALKKIDNVVRSKKQESNIIEMSKQKKEIVVILLVAISSLLVILFFYILFINKTTFCI